MSLNSESFDHARIGRSALVLAGALIMVLLLTVAIFRSSPVPPPESDPLRRDERWLATLTAGNNLSATELYERGLQEWQAGRMNRAKVALERSLELQPNNVDVMRALGQIAYLEGDFDQARVYFEHDLRARPAAQEAYANLAISLLCLERYGDAEMVLTMGLERLSSQESGPLHLIMACVKLEQHDKDAEARYLHRAYNALGDTLPRYANAHWARSLRRSNQFRALMQAHDLDFDVADETSSDSSIDGGPLPGDAVN